MKKKKWRKIGCRKIEMNFSLQQYLSTYQVFKNRMNRSYLSLYKSSCSSNSMNEALMLYSYRLKVCIIEVNYIIFTLSVTYNLVESG